MKLTRWNIILVVIVALLIVLTAGHLIASKLGQDHLAAWGGYLAGVGTVAVALAAFATGMHAITEYRHRTESEQVRWIMELFAQFFQDHRYHFIRQKIDYDDLEEIVPLMDRDLKRDADFAQEDRDLLDQFTDFLNFFEMIAYLIARRQLASTDISQVFDYYLRRMTRVHRAGALLEYLKQTGFENLYSLLLQYGRGN